MNDTDIPAKISIVWGASAGSGYIRAIPNTSQIGINNGWASFPDGFVPLNFQPVGSGGIPPFGQDFNGILNQLSAWSRWLSSGSVVPYDATFQSNVGGYPLGAIVESGVNVGQFYYCLTNNNTSDPDTGGSAWSAFSYVGQNTRIVTATGNIATLVTDQTVGYLRTASGASSTTLPPLNSISNGRVITYQDLDGVTNGFGSSALTIFPNANQALAGGASTHVLNTNLQTAKFTFYYGAGGGINSIWGIGN